MLPFRIHGQEKYNSPKDSIYRSDLKKGDKYSIEDNIDSSMYFYQRAYRLLDSNDEVSFKMGRVFQNSLQLDSALKYYTESLEINPRHNPARLKLIEIYMVMKEYRKALSQIEVSMFESSNYDSISYPVRAQCKMNLGLWASAIADYNRALEFHPKDYTLWNDRGGCQLSLIRYDSALESFTNALKLKPSHASSLVNRAQIYISLNKSELGIVDLEAFVKLKGTDPEVNFQLGLLYHSQQKIEESLSNLNVAEKLGVNNFDLHFFKGLNYYYLDKNEMAVIDLNLALKFNPESAQTYFYLGVCENSISERSGCNHVQKSIDLGFEDANKYFAEDCSE